GERARGRAREQGRTGAPGGEVRSAVLCGAGLTGVPPELPAPRHRGVALIRWRHAMSRNDRIARLFRLLNLLVQTRRGLILRMVAEREGWKLQTAPPIMPSNRRPRPSSCPCIRRRLL